MKWRDVSKEKIDWLILYVYIYQNQLSKSYITSNEVQILTILLF